jgi:hypothetical protein
MKKPLRDFPSLAISNGLRCTCGAPLDEGGFCVVSGRGDGGCRAPHDVFRGRPFEWCLGFADMIDEDPIDFLKITIKETRKNYFDSLRRERRKS